MKSLNRTRSARMFAPVMPGAGAVGGHMKRTETLVLPASNGEKTTTRVWEFPVEAKPGSALAGPHAGSAVDVPPHFFSPGVAARELA